MKAIWKLIAKFLFYAISLALLLYAGSRSLDFVSSTLPPDQQIMGYLALAATSGGMVSWLLVFLHGSEGTGQKAIAGIMVLVDFLGEVALFSMDTLYQSGNNGMTATITPDEIRTVILGMSGLIALNIFATVAFHLFEPENMKQIRESSVRDKLEDESLKLIEKRGEQLAAQLAPRLADQWVADFEARFSDLGSLGLGNLQTRQQAQAQPATRQIWPWTKRTQAQPAQDATPAGTGDPAQLPLSGMGSNGNGHKK